MSLTRARSTKRRVAPAPKKVGKRKAGPAVAVRRSGTDRRDVASERRTFPRPEGRRMNGGRREGDPRD
jgi:hypothetical protein